MGCAQSRIDNEEVVCRCKDRKNLMKEAVIARNAFAAGQFGYAVALKNTGAALSDYGIGESEGNPELHQQPVDTTSQPPPPPSIHIANLPPPPPPLPNFSPSPLQRATTMPTMPFKSQRTGLTIDPISIVEELEEESGRMDKRLDVRNGVGEVGSEAGRSSPPRTPDMKGVPTMPESKGMAWDYFFMMDNMPGPSFDEEENVDENDESEAVGYGETDHAVGNGGHLDDGIEPKTPENIVKNVHREKEDALGSATHIEHSRTASPEFRRVNIAPSITLMQILSALDDHFLRASECAKEVSKLLEATRLQYHSNFADNRGNVDHSARVMRAITWNRSFRGLSNGGEGGKEDLNSEEHETHATVLDKLMAWEKKLYDEVKQGELMKLEYQRKVALLNRQKNRGASVESLEKTKAAVCHLHTKYIVDMQSMDSTVSEVNHIRDEQLFPKLVVLVNEMATMWQNMCNHHDIQLKIVEEFKALDVTQAPKETTKHHHSRTIQLLNVSHEWHLQFDKLITQQKQYIRALNSWLKLNLIPIESSLKEKVSSPPRVLNPPIQPLLHAWHDYLEKLPDDIVKSAISSFAAVVDTIKLHQEEELKLKEKCEETRKEYFRKKQAFEEWYQKYMQRSATNETNHERGEEANPNDLVSEKQFTVESLKKRLEEDVETYQRQCVQVRGKSLGSLKTRLPELFLAMSDYSHACANAYGRLKFINQPQSSS